MLSALFAPSLRQVLGCDTAGSKPARQHHPKRIQRKKVEEPGSQDNLIEHSFPYSLLTAILLYQRDIHLFVVYAAVFWDLFVKASESIL